MRKARLLLAVACLPPAGAAAQSTTVFNRTGSGARAAGMANAFIAVSDDGTAASWNPAGLAQLRKPELSVVSTTAGQANRAEAFLARDELSIFSPLSASYHTTYLDFASLAVPVTLAGKQVTFQGAWRRIYTFDFRDNLVIEREPLTPDGPPRTRIEANADTVGGVDLLSLAGAVRLTSRLTLGGSVNFWRGDWTAAQSISASSPSGSELPDFRTTVDTNRIRGHNLSLGLLLTYPRWSVGLVHQGPMPGRYSGTVDAIDSASPDREVASLDADLRFPRAVGLGAAWRPAPLWTVAFDLTWDDWTSGELDLGLEGVEPVSIFDGQPRDRTGTRNTLSANAGAEHLFRGEGFLVPLRFGVAWEPQGQRNPYVRDPVNFVMLAAGTGYNTNSLKFDAAFQYRWARFQDGDDFSVGPSDPFFPQAVGERNVREWRVKLSVILRITDTEKLRGVFGRIFGG